ncbi:MAG: hypothetical protein ABOK23_02155 [Candidatus Methanoperedens sp.]|nr:hypothetical protein [Candidatus Methanoperedens sp.]MCZ7395358.1 hypothetical protein [Candidatus Methanoperedens sp.]
MLELICGASSKMKQQQNTDLTDGIATDDKIRENPFNLCHPCFSLPAQHRLVAVAGTGGEIAPVEALGRGGLGSGERRAQEVSMSPPQRTQRSQRLMD